MAQHPDLTQPEPLVSIVTPSYNQARFLGQAIESVLSQDYPHVEYLILDGGSTDGSVDVIRLYEDRLAFWVSEPDQGQADAINRGWRRSRGQILAWLNSDDAYLPGAISSIVDAFQREPHASVVTADCRVVDERGAFVRDLPSGGFSLSALLSGNSLPQQGVFCRRDALEAAGWLDNSLRYVLDWALWLKLGLRQVHFHHLPRTVANFRIWQDSKTAVGAFGVSLSGGLPFARERFQVLSDLLSDGQVMRDPELGPMLHEAWLGGLLEMGLLHRVSGEPDEGTLYLAQFARQAPASLGSLPHPQALAQHLAYLEGDISLLVDGFVEELAAQRRGTGAVADPLRWRRELLSETYLVRAWHATHRRDHRQAAGCFAQAIAAQPSLGLQRRVFSPATRALLKAPFMGLGSRGRLQSRADDHHK